MFVFELVHDFARVFNIKKTGKLEEGLYAGAYIRIYLLFSE